MGQTRGMSIVSSEEDLRKSNPGGQDTDKLIKTRGGDTNNTISASTDNTKSRDVDFFNDRDYYKIFLETSKE